MLVLTRKIDEEIKIGKDITLKILAISENQTKIGIEAPKGVQIFRNEIYTKVKENAIQASKASIQKAENLNKYKIKKVN
jgi:carbon storage regulator